MHRLTTDQFIEIINALHDGFFIVDHAGIIQMVNPTLLQLTGYREEELVGSSCSILGCDACERLRSDAAPHWCVLFQERFTKRKPCHIRKKDGNQIAVLKSARVLYSDDGAVLGAVEVIMDLTEINQRDEKIQTLAKIAGEEGSFSGITGNSPAIRKVFSLLQRTAGSDAPILLLGESGTGKELAAQAIHDLGRRKSGAFIKINCSAISPHLLESELFGHVKGAFTGAVRDRAGYFESAAGGDIFLDEIGDMPLPLQAKLLRVLETKTVTRVGDHLERPVDARFIAATNRPLQELVAKKEFREDLFFRLNVIPIVLPALRERTGDIPLLARVFLRSIAVRDNEHIKKISPEAMRMLEAYPWPGNVRELRSVLEYACIVTPGEVITPDVLQLGTHNYPGTMPSLPAPVRPVDPYTSAAEEQRREICDALAHTKGNLSQAAKRLGIYRGTLRNRMLRLGISLEKHWS